MDTPLEKIISRNWMTSTEQPDQISLLTTEIGGSIQYFMGILNPYRNNTENRTDPTIQPTSIHFNQSTLPGHSDCDHLPLGNFYSGTDVLRSGRNVDNQTGMKQQGLIMTTIPESNRAKNCGMFVLVSSS